MLKDYRFSNGEANSLVHRIHEQFSWLSVDAILDIGSHAKDEANHLSDHDCWVLAQAKSGLIRDSYDRNADISEVFENTIDLKVAELYGIPISNIGHDEIDARQQALETKSGVRINIVFTDTRLAVLNLALETPLSAVRTHWLTLTSNVIYDSDGLICSLQKLIVSNRCFHWFPTVDLQIARYRRRSTLKSLLVPSQYDVELARKGVLRWVVWTLNYIRFAIGAWTLVRDGYYTYQRGNVLRFIAANLPDRYFALAHDLYDLKCNPHARLTAIKHFLNDPQESTQGFTDKIHELDGFFSLVAMKTEELRPEEEPDRREENARSILDLTSRWLPVPQFCLTDWIGWCNEKERTVRELMQISGANTT